MPGKVPLLPHRSGFSWYLERPHECQIGSGELVRSLLARHSRAAGSGPPLLAPTVFR